MRQVTATIVPSTSAGATFNGPAFDSNQLIAASFQAVFSDAAATGTLKLQYSCDHATTAVGGWTGTPTVWTDIPSATSAVASGAAAGLILNPMAYRWIRVVYTRSAGAGTVVVNMFAQSV